MTDTLTPNDFWSRIDDINAGMLGPEGGRPVPMSHYPDPENNALWFITARNTHIAEALADGPKAMRYVLACGTGKLYASIDGTASISHDREKLEEFWNAVASAWFEEDENDPDVVLVRLDLTEAEVWATDGGLAFLYEVAKANLTDTKPDMGTHGTLRFAA